MFTDVSQRTLLRLQVKILAIVIFVMLFCVTVAAGSQLGHHQRIQHQIAAANQRAHFWRVIAGTESGSTPTVDNALANELQKRLGPASPEANLPEAITSYRGSTNLYAGITDALGGLDPFTESPGACQYCGPLTDSFKLKLLRVKRGDVEGLIRSERPAGTNGYRLTPFSLSGLETGLLVWLVGGPLTLGMAYLMARSPRREEESDDYENSGVRVALAVLSPPVFLPYYLVRVLGHGVRRVGGSYSAEAEEKVDQVQEIAKQISDTCHRLHDAQAAASLTQACRDIPVLLKRVQRADPSTVVSSATQLLGHLQSLQGAVTRYLDIQAHPKYYDNSDELLSQGGRRFDDFSEFIVHSIRLVNRGDLSEYRANLATLSPPQMPELSR